jgi:glycosyltransferase involved in cell wall biosynthesis
MSAPLVTVLIDAYNYGHFIEEAIESVLSQDFPSDQVEIVVVDDGSTDDTSERVKKYGSRIRYFHKSNGGQASAFNLGFTEARGEIIAFLDADDYWLPGKLQRIVGEFQRNPDLGMVYHQFLEVDTATNEQKKSTVFLPVSGSFLEEREEFFWYNPPGTAAAFRRKFLERVLPIPEEIRMLADGYVNALIPFVAPVHAIPECLAAYRVHGRNHFYADGRQMPRETRENRLQMWRILTDAKRRWLTENGYTKKRPAVRALLDRWAIYEENEQFALNPPGRMRFFVHLLRYNRCYGPHLSRRLQAINWINMFGALLTGYEHFRLLDRWSLAATGLLKRFVTGSVVSRHNETHPGAEPRTNHGARTH